MSDESPAGRSCAWCSAVAPESATQCPACGAALAQRESIAGLVIPGVTTIDPALQAIAGQPMHISGPSPSQGMASGVVVAGAIGGPVGLAALGGFAAVAAVEYMGAGRDGSGRPGDLADVGRPSEITLRALERLERQDGEGSENAPDDDASDPWRDEPGGGLIG
jgi:hypothetical protein